MNPEPIPTPLTDQAEWVLERVHSDGSAIRVVYGDFARTLERQTAEQAAMIAGLRRYVRHGVGCNPGNGHCSCGLDSALAATDKSENP